MGSQGDQGHSGTHEDKLEPRSVTTATSWGVVTWREAVTLCHGPKMHMLRARRSWKLNSSGSWRSCRPEAASCPQGGTACASRRSAWHPAPNFRAWKMAAASFPPHIPSSFLLWLTFNRIIWGRESGKHSSRVAKLTQRKAKLVMGWSD